MVPADTETLVETPLAKHMPGSLQALEVVESMG
jgi:hypothetical protein